MSAGTLLLVGTNRDRATWLAANAVPAGVQLVERSTAPGALRGLQPGQWPAPVDVVTAGRLPRRTADDLEFVVNELLPLAAGHDLTRASYVRTIGDPPRRLNRQAIADAGHLGYLPGHVVDLTFGRGRFWASWQPEQLTACDLHPRPDCPHPLGGQVLRRDFTDTRFDDDTFDAAVLDPPYKLNGTGDRGGPAASDGDYGVADGYVSIDDRHQLIYDGIDEAVRITRRDGFVLVKCMTQVSSGRTHWQERLFTDRLHRAGADLVARLYVAGYRSQPPGRRQVRVHTDHSTLLVARVGTPRAFRVRRLVNDEVIGYAITRAHAEQLATSSGHPCTIDERVVGWCSDRGMYAGEAE